MKSASKMKFWKRLTAVSLVVMMISGAVMYGELVRNTHALANQPAAARQDATLFIKQEPLLKGASIIEEFPEAPGIALESNDFGL